jgi:hypothetical protein
MDRAELELCRYCEAPKSEIGFMTYRSGKKKETSSIKITKRKKTSRTNVIGSGDDVMRGGFNGHVGFGWSCVREGNFEGSVLGETLRWYRRTFYGR